ncbi:MAG: sensor histidine kinase [Planctomycetota bacterium]
MSLKHHKRRAAKNAQSAISPDQLAHELNNLLDGSLRGVGMTLRRLDELELDDETRALLEKHLGAADRSMRLMADVIERYVNQPANRGVSLHDLVDSAGGLLDVLTHAVNVYGPSIEQRGIELVTRLDPEISDLPAGPIYTVLANAINNALQAIERSVAAPGEDEHRITVRLVGDPQHPGHLLVEITDTGVGLDPRLIDDRGRFRFGVTTRAGGHGVGLGVCRQIAEDMHGQLTLEPHADGGTRFALSVPLPTAPPHVAFGQDAEPRRAG